MYRGRQRLRGERSSTHSRRSPFLRRFWRTIRWNTPHWIYLVRYYNGCPFGGCDVVVDVVYLEVVGEGGCWQEDQQGDNEGLKDMLHCGL